MRRPTPESDLLRWHAAALRDGRLPRHEDEPQPGWYRLRRVRGGPWVPVLIGCRQETDPETGELVAPETLYAVVAGEEVDPATIWTHCQPISRAAWLALIETCRAIPAMAAPDRPLDLARTPILPRSPR